MNDENNKCVIRAASLEDADFLLEIRNEPEIIALGSTQRAVDPHEHQTWLKKVLKSDSHLVLVVENHDRSESIGYARLDRSSEDVAVITIALIKSWRGRSIGPIVIRQATHDGFSLWSTVETVVAYVLDGNEPSARSFVKAGFKPTDKPSLEGHQVFVMTRP